MGILLAYALLTIVIHVHNCTEKKHSRVVARPIEASSMKKSHSVSGIKPVGILPKVRASQDPDSSNHWEIDVSDNVIDLHLVVQIYVYCLEKTQVMKALTKMGLSHLKNSMEHFTPFKPSVSTTPDVSPISTISQKILNHGLQLIEVDGDGNCFFRAVAMCIVSDLKLWQHILVTLGIDACSNKEASIEAISAGLRQSVCSRTVGSESLKV